MDERQQAYFDFVTSHDKISTADLEFYFPDWQDIAGAAVVRAAFRERRLSEAQERQKAKERTAKRREEIEAAKEEAIKALVALLGDADSGVVFKAASKIAGSEFVFKAKHAEKEAEAAFAESQPKDEEYPDVE